MRGSEAREQRGDTIGVGGVIGEDAAEVLLFVLNHGQVDEEEHDGEQCGEPAAASGDSEAGGDEERADVERIARIGVGAAGGELLVLGKAAGGPGA